MTEKLRDALAFYADDANWRQNGPLDPNSANFTGGPARAALAAAPQPAIEGDPWQVLEQAEQPLLSDGYAAVVAVAAGIWLVLPLDKAKPDREALVEAIRAARCEWANDGDSESCPDQAIADALLARGLRLPGDESMAWALVGDDEAVLADTVRWERGDVDAMFSDLGPSVRVAIRVVEGGDDAGS